MLLSKHKSRWRYRAGATGDERVAVGFPFCFALFSVEKRPGQQCGAAVSTLGWDLQLPRPQHRAGAQAAEVGAALDRALTCLLVGSRTTEPEPVSVLLTRPRRGALGRNTRVMGSLGPEGWVSGPAPCPSTPSVSSALSAIAGVWETVLPAKETPLSSHVPPTGLLSRTRRTSLGDRMWLVQGSEGLPFGADLVCVRVPADTSSWVSWFQ